MSILDYLLRLPNKKTAPLARDRLQLILAKPRSAGQSDPDYLPAMKRDMLAVICRYINVDPEHIQVQLEREGDCDILEVNIMLPESQENAHRTAMR